MRRLSANSYCYMPCPGDCVSSSGLLNFSFFKAGLQIAAPLQEGPNVHRADHRAHLSADGRRVLECIDMLRIGHERSSLRQQGSEPLFPFPVSLKESRGGRVPPTPGARGAPAKNAVTRRCCRLPPQEGCRPLVNPPLADVTARGNQGGFGR